MELHRKRNDFNEKWIAFRFELYGHDKSDPVSVLSRDYKCIFAYQSYVLPVYLFPVIVNL